MELGFLNKPVSKNCEKIEDICANIGIFNTIYASNIINTNNNPVLLLETAFPVAGDGSSLSPVTLAQPSAPCRILFWNGSTWNHNVPSGITEVTIGDITNGANFATIQEAFTLGCNFVRVITSMIEPAILTLPTNAIIYVDPGVTLTLATGQMDVTNRSLTFMGNASLSSSTVILNGTLLGDVNTYIYFYNCRCVNNNTGPITASTTNNFGHYQATGTTFVASNALNSLFGDGSNAIINLVLTTCVIEGGGANSELFLASVQPSSLVKINGLTIDGTWRVSPGILATINSLDYMIDNVLIRGLGSTALIPFLWEIRTSGMMSQFQQSSGTFVQMNIISGIQQLNNINIHHMQYTSSGGPSKLSNVICGGYMYINSGPPVMGIQLQNIQLGEDSYFQNIRHGEISNLFVNGNFDSGCHDTHFSNCHITGTFGGGGVGPSNANDRCTFRGLHTDTLFALGFDTSFIGGTHRLINVFGGGLAERIAFIGVRCTSLMTVTNGRDQMIDSCSIEALTISSPACSVSNSVIATSVICGPGTRLTNCRVDSGGAGNNIDASASDVQISNCTVGLSAGAVTSTITPIVIGGATATLIVNCKTRTAIAPSATVINCGVF